MTLISSPIIEKQLSQGIDVVADRYSFSGIAFSAGKVCVSFLARLSSMALLKILWR